jgi:hypothetical protein
VKYILFAILIYLAYQFIFNLVIPVLRTSQKIKKGFREMHSQMNEKMKEEQGYKTQTATKPPQSSNPSGDYIDFEEIK